MAQLPNGTSVRLSRRGALFLETPSRLSLKVKKLPDTMRLQPPRGGPV
jgi:hypothetical protein